VVQLDSIREMDGLGSRNERWGKGSQNGLGSGCGLDILSIFMTLRGRLEYGIVDEAVPLKKPQPGGDS